MAPTSNITKFTNGRLVHDGALVNADLWVDGTTGKILSSQSAFYSRGAVADHIADLKGKILSPGLIDVQLNGAHGFNFSVPENHYATRLRATTRKLIRSGVTSYVPTVTSNKPEVYHAVLPHLGASTSRSAEDGAESLGAHVEGPFLSPCRNGIHPPEVLIKAETFADIESCYGGENFENIKMITAAPELGKMQSLIPEFTERGIIYSIGHSDATFEQAQAAVSAGATMVTHMFNAMRPFGHRDPNIFGLLGQSSSPVTSPPSSPRTTRPSSIIESPKASRPGSPRNSRRSTPRSSLSISSTPAQLSAPKLAEPETGKPFFGLIADGIHLHSSSIQIAHAAHPSGTILVTDAMQLAGCADGTYEWTNGERIIKKGPLLTLEANGRLAGSAIELIDCVNNFKKWTNCSVPEALGCVTSTPARMLGEGIVERKGGLKAGMDADLVILEESADGTLIVDEVWKFGTRVA